MKERDLLRMQWSGKLVSFNRYLKTRTLKKKDGKYSAIMYASTEYKNLVKALVISLKLIWKKEPITKYVDMILKISRWKVSDTGNVEKPISDALETAGVIKNDNRIRNIYILRSYHPKGEEDLLEIILIPILSNESVVQILQEEMAEGFFSS